MPSSRPSSRRPGIGRWPSSPRIRPCIPALTRPCWRRLRGVHAAVAPVDLSDPYQWWSYVPGAYWRHPGGPGTSARDLPRHPVTHVAWPDTLAYATWAGKQIPTEAEWEYAARGGLPDSVFAWGDELTPGGRHMANTWQGEFPHQNLRLDGYAGTSPVGAFPANGYGLHDMIGNVWEWTSDWYAAHPSRAAARQPAAAHHPPGQPGVRPGGGQRRTRSARRADPAQGHEGRVVPVRAELLPPVPSRGTDGPADRHLDLPPGIPLHRPPAA